MSERLEYKSLAFEVKGKAPDGSQFEGHAAAFHNIDDSYFNDIIAPGAFKADLDFFLKEGFVAWQHHWSSPIGKPVKAEEDTKGLYVEAKISDTSLGRDVKVLLVDEVVKRLSIGFKTIGREWLEDSTEVMTYWQKHGYTPSPEDIAKSAYGARLLTRVKVFEFSPVSMPANKNATITNVKQGEDGEERASSRSFADHSEFVLATMEEYIERVKSLKALRQGSSSSSSSNKKRQLSEENMHRLKQLRTMADQLLDSAVEEGEGAADIDALKMAFLKRDTSLKLLGVH